MKMTLVSPARVEAGSGMRSVTADHRLQQLYLVHAPNVRRFLAQWTRHDSAVTEQLVRETLRRASRAIDQADSDAAAVSPWLLTLARRVAMDFARSRLVLGGDEAPRPEDVRKAVGQASGAQVAQALNQLRPEHRAVIAELFYRGRSVAEAATFLAVDEATVTRRTGVALRELRQAIETLTASGSGFGR